MAMSDEAMFAPPQGITIEAVNGMLAERGDAANLLI